MNLPWWLCVNPMGCPRWFNVFTLIYLVEMTWKQTLFQPVLAQCGYDGWRVRLLKGLRLDLVGEVVDFNIQIQGISSDKGITITTIISSKLLFRFNGVKQRVVYQGHRTGFSAGEWSDVVRQHMKWQIRLDKTVTFYKYLAQRINLQNRPSIILFNQQCD